jgi:hypothetical protein
VYTFYYYSLIQTTLNTIHTLWVQPDQLHLGAPTQDLRHAQDRLLIAMDGTLHVIRPDMIHMAIDHGAAWLLPLTTTGNYGIGNGNGKETALWWCVMNDMVVEGKTWCLVVVIIQTVSNLFSYHWDNRYAHYYRDEPPPPHHYGPPNISRDFNKPSSASSSTTPLRREGKALIQIWHYTVY